MSQVLHLYSSVRLQKFRHIFTGHTIASTVELSVEFGSSLTVFRYISGYGTVPLTLVD